MLDDDRTLILNQKPIRNPTAILNPPDASSEIYQHQARNFRAPSLSPPKYL
jgi:hypothetical protein